jgi:uncharacterized NAD(P)/FAD-binding protein YdhS
MDLSPSSRGLTLCVVGAGPRGLAVLERICANATHCAPDTPITVHVVDPHGLGAGRVWRTAQPGELLMNTVASQVTMFTDDTVELAGPVVPGPSLYQWAKSVPVREPEAGYPDEVLAQARALDADAYPTRGFYGHYLEWVARRVVASAPEHVRVVVHHCLAVSLDDETGGSQVLALADGTVLRGLDVVILAQGHVDTEPTAAETRLSEFATRHGLTYIPPANPADVDLSTVHPGQKVILRGLGLNFFDHMALLTLDRGGRFERTGTGLAYQPSGREPVLYAGCRRGIPHHARGENEKGAHGFHTPAVLTPAAIARLRARPGLDFRSDLWPLIAKEVETVYYTTLVSTRDGAAAGRFQEQYLALPWGSGEEARLLDRFDIAPADRWDWGRIAHPAADQRFAGPAEFRTWLLDYLRRDVAEARRGNLSGPLKAALDVLRDLRNWIRLIVDHGGLTGRSHRDDLQRWYTPFNAFLSIGPPASRIEEMIALIESGVLHVLGPDIRVGEAPREGLFVAESPAVPGSAVRAGALIEARLPDPDLRRTVDPLLRHLLATGQCTTYRIGDPEGAYETGGLAVTPRPYRLVDAQGRAHPRRFAFGVPTEAVHWVTAAGIRPGVNSVTLSDADAIARAAITGADAAGIPTGTIAA